MFFHDSSWCCDSDPEHVLRKEDSGPFPAEPRVPNLRGLSIHRSKKPYLNHHMFRVTTSNQVTGSMAPGVNSCLAPPLDPEAVEFQPKLRPFPEAKDKDPQDLTQCN
ncbi:hypothetical protein Y1Q_0018213 [Alligator mississippiensis]|uniref:Uncharacterized protein n=1 Tax=Alligator mississippiensis TaxID=8496 RepID=A0A151MZM6_ALLMI|nr:hypothetical protein Y1Q_0018213 [Alligator mississippiensis]